MIDPNHRPIVATRLYGLEDAKPAVGIQPEDLLRLGAAGHLTLCVLVPANARAYTIAPRSTAISDAKVQLDKHFSRTRPSEKDIPAIQDGTISALCLSQAQCREIFAFGLCRAWEFSSAYAINTTCNTGYSDPLELKPVRLPLFKADGSDAPQGHWRFAVYPANSAFPFDETSGFPGPHELLITLNDVRVLGKELGRLPKAIDSTPSAEPPNSTSDEANAQAPDRASAAKSTKPSSDEAANVRATDSAQSSKAKPKRKRKKTKADVLAEGKSDIVFLQIEEVMRRTKLSTTTIYDYMNKKHKLYDPTFPTQILIGNRSVGWLATEIDAWIQNRIDKSRTKPAKKK